MDLATARRQARRPSASRVRSNDYYQFDGGVNETDTPLKVPPGNLLGCKNYEPGIRGGYRRVSGFERFDGRPSPTDATYWILNYDGASSHPEVGDQINGLTSGADGVVLAVVTDGAAGYVALSDVPGRSITYEDNESLEIDGGATFAIANGVAVERGSLNDDEEEDLLYAATNLTRDQIQKVPGTGRVRGQTWYGSAAYAFRDDGSGGLGFFKSSASGWQSVALNRKLRFDTGSTEIAEGDVLTGATSGATATAERIVIQSGGWTTNDAVGFITLGLDQSGTFQLGENIEVSASTVAAATAADEEQVLLPGGRFVFRIHNFYGHTRTRSLYGVDGVNRGFEFLDVAASGGSAFTQIETGMEVDKPNRLAVNNQHLFMSFPGGSLQNSGIGRPLQWTVRTGAAEMSLGDECTGFIEEIGDQLFVYARNKTFTVAGLVSADFQLLDYSAESGGLPWTEQRIGQGIVLDDRGFTSLSATDRYGNYSSNSFSQLIEETVSELKLTACASVTSRGRNLYRCFFDNGRFISIGVRGTSITGMTFCDYGMRVNTITSMEDSTGRERILFGSDDGYVYEADRGKSFDGGDIEAFARTAFHHSREPSRIKRYRRAQIDIKSKGRTTIQVSIDFSFANPDAGKQPNKAFNIQGGGGFWSVSKWNFFKWSTGVVPNASMKIEGSGTNIGMQFYHNSNREESHELQGVTFQTSRRRLERGVT